MIAKGSEVRTKVLLPRMFSNELGDQAPYRWIANRKAQEPGKVAGTLHVNGTEYTLVVHVGELEAIYRQGELEEVQ